MSESAHIALLMAAVAVAYVFGFLHGRDCK